MFRGQLLSGFSLYKKEADWFLRMTEKHYLMEAGKVDEGSFRDEILARRRENKKDVTSLKEILLDVKRCITR